MRMGSTPDGSAERRRDHVVGRVGGLEIERDVLPHLQRRVQLGATLGGSLENVRTFLEVVATLVSRLDHRLDGHAVGGRTRGDPHRVATRAAAELTYHAR